MKKEMTPEELVCVEQFSDELKEGFIKIARDSFSVSLAEIFVKYIDDKLKIYKDYFEVYAKKQEKYFEKKT